MVITGTYAQPDVDIPAAFFYQTRASFPFFLYANAVNQTGCGGGNQLFMPLWAQYGFDR
jgi:hypothetical protein